MQCRRGDYVVQAIMLVTSETLHHCVVILSSIVLFFTKIVDGEIGCFVCTSINRQNNDCEDTFNNTDKYYKPNCWASRTGRFGLFPATQCIKMVANDDETGFSLIVRDCVVDDGGTNSETEIGRQSHCGWMRVIKYNGKRMRGCILSCNTDGCNRTSPSIKSPSLTLIGCVVLLTLIAQCIMGNVR